MATVATALSSRLSRMHFFAAQVLATKIIRRIETMQLNFMIAAMQGANNPLDIFLCSTYYCYIQLVARQVNKTELL